MALSRCEPNMIRDGLFITTLSHLSHWDMTSMILDII